MRRLYGNGANFRDRGGTAHHSGRARPHPTDIRASAKHRAFPSSPKRNPQPCRGHRAYSGDIDGPAYRRHQDGHRPPYLPC